MPEFSEYRNQDSSPQENHSEPMAVLPVQENTTANADVKSLKDLGETLDGQSYFLGEVPQSFMVDPQVVLPLNSVRLSEVSNIPHLMDEVNTVIEAEVSKIQTLQKRISFWEEKIEKNKAAIAKHQHKVKKNLADIVYDKKNRDYWWSRSESVMLDYAYAEASNREDQWKWLVKKYGLKNGDGTEIDSREKAIDELCNGATRNLALEYKHAGNKYDQAKVDKETDNTRLIRENGRWKTSNDTLQGYISTLYTQEIEPLQDGVLLLKEFLVKLKGMSEDSKATFGDLRAWAESFLDEFIQANPRVIQVIVTEFRKLASIPLPAENC